MFRRSTSGTFFFCCLSSLCYRLNSAAVYFCSLPWSFFMTLTSLLRRPHLEWAAFGALTLSTGEKLEWFAPKLDTEGGRWQTPLTITCEYLILKVYWFFFANQGYYFYVKSVQISINYWNKDTLRHKINTMRYNVWFLSGVYSGSINCHAIW